MDIIRTIWIVNFFFFLLVLIFLWSKLYLVSRKIAELSQTIKKFDEFKEVAPAEPESQKKAPKPNPQGSR
jgi:cell division protein FtsL